MHHTVCHMSNSICFFVCFFVENWHINGLLIVDSACYTEEHLNTENVAFLSFVLHLCMFSALFLAFVNWSCTAGSLEKQHSTHQSNKSSSLPLRSEACRASPGVSSGQMGCATAIFRTAITQHLPQWWNLKLYRGTQQGAVGRSCGFSTWEGGQGPTYQVFPTLNVSRGRWRKKLWRYTVELI